jgi:glycolate oxidase iron-sulfur subunit
VARGRIALLRGLIEGRLALNRDLREPLFDCLLCGACTSNCFPGIPTADLILDARAEYQDRVGRGPVHRLLFERLLPYPERLRAALHAVAFGKRTGLSRLAAALGLLRFLGRDFPKAEAIVDQLPRKSLREECPPQVLPGAGAQLRIGYFVGCGLDLVSPQAGLASLRLLRELAASVEILANCCCGLPALNYGDLEAARRLARQNLAVLGNDRFDLIVTDCSSCAAFLKKYPNLFPSGGEERRQAESLASRTRDLLETLVPRLAGERGEGRLTVTYHDPCHASRGQKITRAPRELLRSLPGVEYREMPEADWCCGGAGSYALSHYELSRQVLDRKMKNLEKSGAQVVATSCPACVIQLSYGVRLHRLPVRVAHIAELVADSACVPPEGL